MIIFIIFLKEVCGISNDYLKKLEKKRQSRTMQTMSTKVYSLPMIANKNKSRLYELKCMLSHIIHNISPKDQ